MDKIYMASLETRNFTFNAVGCDKRSARQSLIDGLEQHRRQYELAFDWYGLDEICVEEFNFGVAYRDGSELKPPKMSDDEIQFIADEALNRAVRYIQNELNVKHGDLAGQYFSDEIMSEQFVEYIKQELNDNGGK